MFMGEESSTAQSAGTRAPLQKGGGSKSQTLGKMYTSENEHENPPFKDAFQALSIESGGFCHCHVGFWGVYVLLFCLRSGEEAIAQPGGGPLSIKTKKNMCVI